MGELRVKIYKFDTKLMLALTMMVFKTFLAHISFITYSDFADNIIVILASILFGASIIEKKYPLKTLIVYGVIGLLGLYSAMQIGNVGFLITIITCLAIREEKIDRVVRLLYQLELSLFLVTVIISIILQLLGIQSIYTSVSGKIRYNFGFTHPNTFSVILNNIILMWVYLNYSKKKAKDISAIIALAWLAFYFTKTRTFLVDILCLSGMLILAKKDSVKVNKVLVYTAKFIVPVLAVVTSLLAILYMKGNRIAILVDNLLSSRIKLAAYGISKYGVTLFGQNLSSISVTYDPYWGLNSFTFDSIYALFFTNIGIVWLLVICVSFYLLAKKNDIRQCILIIAWALYGMTEVHGINCYQCFPILMIVDLLNNPQKNKEGMNEW